MNKGQMMKRVYTEKELRNIDSAIPIEYWKDKDNNPNYKDPAIHVMNYNDNGAFGKLENIEEIATERNIPGFSGNGSYIVPIAVIDQSVNGLFLYDIDSNWDSEKIEEFINSQGHHLSNCSWGVFDGQTIDLRNE
jgi:hypothetical protein